MCFIQVLLRLLGLKNMYGMRVKVARGKSEGGGALIFCHLSGRVFEEGSKNIKRDWEGCRKKFDDSNENVFDPLLLPPPTQHTPDKKITRRLAGRY